MNEKIRRWKCPVCSLPANFDSLLIDHYFLKIMEEIKDDIVPEIEIFQSGEFNIVFEKTKTEEENKKVEEIIDICDD